MKLARTLITKTRALPRVTLKRAFCSKPAAPAPSVAPSGAATDKKEKEFQEQTLHLADGNKINVKFDDTSVSYELPEKIGGTTHRKSRSNCRHLWTVHGDVHLQQVQHKTVEVFHKECLPSRSRTYQM
jgi:hypothetical protein